MAALKIIKVLYTVDVSELEQNIKLAEAAVGGATKSIEGANAQLAASQEEVAQASSKAAQALGEQSLATKILLAPLRALQAVLGAMGGAAGVLQTVLGASTNSMIAMAIAVVKLVALIQSASGWVVKLGTSLEVLTAKAVRLSLDGLGKLRLVMAALEGSFPLLAKGIDIAGHSIGGLVRWTALGAAGLGKFLTSLPVIAPAARVAETALTGVTGGLGSMLKAASEGSRVFGPFTKFFSAIGSAAVPFINSLLRISSVIPSIGLGLTLWVGIPIAKWLFNAAQNALQLAKAAAETASNLADVSSRMGINVEALQQYQFAAKQSGVEIETLNSGLERFQRKTAEAQQGTGTLAKEFERLGIALVDNKGFVRDGTAVFEDYLAAIGRTQNSQEQLRLAFVAFGKEGASLVNLAKEGEAGFAGLRQESEQLGTVLSVGLLRSYKEINDQLDANQQRLEALRLKNSLFLAQVAVKWDNLKTSIKAATLELIAFLNPLETRSVSALSSKLKETETAIERTKNVLNSSIANLPLVTGIMQVFLGGLIQDQERILEAIKIAKGEQLQVKAERPEDVTAQIQEQIAARELELSQQQQLLEAAKQGEDARLRMAAAIQAENDARALGAQATVDEQERIKQTTLALTETQQALEQVTAANQNFAAGEELRLQTLEKIGTASARTDQALLSNVQSLLVLGNASTKTQMEFRNLSNRLVESSVALDKLEKELAQGAGQGEDAKKKFGELSKEAEKLRNAVEGSRSGLQKMEQNLRDTTGLAGLTGDAFVSMGADFAASSRGVDTLNDSLSQNRAQLESVGDAAEAAGNSIAGTARETINLGSVVAGDATDPTNIQRALNKLNADLRAVQSTFGDAGLGFKEIQSRALQTQIAKLEADLRLSNEETQKGIIQAVINANSSLTGEALDKAITDRLALERRYGLLPSSGSSRPGFTSMSVS